MFVSECYDLKSIVRAVRNDCYTELYNIIRLIHTILMYDSVECQITSQKNAMSFPDHVDNIQTYVEREYLRGRPFTEFQ